MEQRDAEPVSAIGIQSALHEPATELRGLRQTQAPPWRGVPGSLQKIRLIPEDQLGDLRMIQPLADLQLRVRLQHLSKRFQIGIVANQIDGSGSTVRRNQVQDLFRSRRRSTSPSKGNSPTIRPQRWDWR